MAKISIVGTGPGSPDYVTPAARKAVQKAQVVIGADRSLSLFQEDIKGETLKLTGKNVEELFKYANEAAEKGKDVALLSTGDPGFSGLLGSVLRRNLSKGVEVQVIPGVSSIQACAAAIVMNWEEAVLFTFHDGVTDQKKSALLTAAKAGKDIMLLPEPRTFKVQDIAQFLINNGVGAKTPIVVCENLTLKEEKITKSTLKEASKLSFSPTCVMVIKTA